MVRLPVLGIALTVVVVTLSVLATGSSSDAAQAVTRQSLPVVARSDGDNQTVPQTRQGDEIGVARRRVRSGQVFQPNPLRSRVGISFGDSLASMSDLELEQTLTDVAHLGATWIRFDMGWDAARPRQDGPYDWARYDRTIRAAHRLHLKCLPILTYTPQWARQAVCVASPKSSPANPAAFATFARDAARRYAPMGIHVWEIWNEPNITKFWLPKPSPKAYTHLLKLTFTAIKSIDAKATIVSGGLAPAGDTGGDISPIKFTEGMYRDGAKAYFDVLGYHPYCFPALPTQRLSWSGWSQMDDLGTSLRSVMKHYGDGAKKVWATEFGAPTGGPGPAATESGDLVRRDTCG